MSQPDVGWVSDSVTQQIQEQSPKYSGGVEMSGYAMLTRPMLPIGWCELQSRDLTNDEKADIVDGPFGSNLKASEYIDAGTPIARIQNVKRLNFINKNIYYVSDEKAENLKRHSFKGGDILITKLGDPLGLACIAPHGIDSGIIVADLVRFRPDIRVVSIKYLNYLLNSQAVIKQIAEHVKGTTRPRINLKVIRDLRLPIAPLAEQQQIAAKLDELLALVDTLKTRLDTIPKILKRFRQSVLAAAVSGKLTEDWRVGNPQSPISQDDHLDKKLDRVEDKETFFHAPPQWAWVRFGSQVKLINGDRGKNYPNQSEYVSKGLPFINTGHIEPNGTLSNERMNYITREKFNSLGSGKIGQNDLVYCLRGATMGKTAMVAPLKEGAIASSLVIVRPKKSITTSFTYIFLVSPQGKDLILRYDNGSAQPNLSAKSLGLFPLALPPVEEQTEIINRVEQLFTYADQIEHRVKDAQTRVNHLTQSILAKVFRGELTAEWREQNLDLISGDNSAEALLTRIKAEREMAKPVKQAQRLKAK